MTEIILKQNTQSKCTSINPFLVSGRNHKHVILKQNSIMPKFWNDPPPQISSSTLTLVYTCLQYKSFENTEEKREIPHNEQFLPFPQCFLPI